MKSLEMFLNAPLEIGLELMSVADVTSYPYPSGIRSKNEPEQPAATPPTQRLELQVDNWEDEGGQVLPCKGDASTGKQSDGDGTK